MDFLTSRFVLIPVAVLMIVAIVLIAVLVGGGDDDEQAAAKPNVGKVSAQDLRIGDCITDGRSTMGDVRTFAAVPCAKPHDGEVYTLIALAGAKYPGKDFVTGKGNRGCRARLKRQATAKAFRDRNLAPYRFVYPTRASWAQEYRQITCLATFKKPRTGKLAQRAAAS